MYRLAIVFGLASINPPHRVYRLRQLISYDILFLKVTITDIVVHKIGSAPYPGHSVINDIGIISFPNRHTILYAIFIIMDSKESNEADYEIIADNAKVLYPYNHNK